MSAVILCFLAAVADLDYLDYRIGPEPAGVSITFAAGEDSRGFTWFTDESVGTGEVALVEGDAGASDAARFDAAVLKQPATLTASQDHGRPVHSFQARFYSLGGGAYSYRLGSPGHYRYGRFQVKASPRPVTILNLNDAQTRLGPKLWMWERSCAAADRLLGRENIDFILDGGDRFDGAFKDAGGNTCPVHQHRYFQWAIATDAANRFLADVPLVWTAGNHDYYKLDSEKKPYAFIAEDWQWKDGYSYGGHSFDCGGVHVVTVPYCLAWKGVNEKSLAWLERDLAATAGRGRAKWTILSMHAGPYSTGDNMRAPVCTNLIKRVGALCAKYHVDLVLQAHDHTFSKTLPYRWDAAGFTTNETDEEVINLSPRRTEANGELYDTDPRGTYYVSAGCAGHRIGELNAFANRNGVFSYTNRLFKVAIGRINVDSAYSKTGDDASKDVGRMMFGVIRIDGDRLAYDWYTVGDDGVAALYDTLRVRKSAVRFDEGRNLVERLPSRELTVEDNLEWLKAGRVPGYAIGNVIRWLELKGVDIRGAGLPPRETVDPPRDAVFPPRGFSLGYMLDISRDKVPTMPTLRAIVDTLAAAGFNELQLYTEHTFAYRKHETAWKGCSPMTAGEIRELDDYAWARGVRLVPNQNSFGHLEKWFIHDEYRPLAETPDGYHLTTPKLDTSSGHALCPTDPKAFEFLAGLYDELLPCFRHSDRIHVGCDEVWDIFDCHGRSQPLAREAGVAGVYMHHLTNVNALVKARGRRMEFWADMVLWAPDSLHRLPKDVLAVNWGYASEKSVPGYTAEVEGRALALKRRGIDMIVAPSTKTYEGAFNLLEDAFGNISLMVDVARRYEAKGLLLTEWGDGGHPAPFLANLPAIAFTALRCRGAATDERSLAAEIDRLAGAKVGAALLALGKIRKAGRFSEPDVAAGRAALALADLSAAPPLVTNGCAMLGLLLRAAECRQRGGKDPSLAAEYRRLWLEANRPGGLDHSLSQVMKE